MYIICLLMHKVPCVAVVENMCHFEADGKRYYPFGRGSGPQAWISSLNVNFSFASSHLRKKCRHIYDNIKQLCTVFGTCLMVFTIFAGCSAVWNTSSI